MAMASGHTAMDWDTAPMDMASDTTAMVLVDTMARGLLMLSQRPRLMLILLPWWILWWIWTWPEDIRIWTGTPHLRIWPWTLRLWSWWILWQEVR